MAHIDDDSTQRANLRYIRQTMEQPMLERAHELELARRWKEDGDEKALHEMIRAYARLVVAVAAKFKHYGLPMGDLIQEGNLGLMEAAARFEPERGHRFSTYATWWVRAQVQDYVLRNWSIVRTGTTAAQKSLFFNLRRLRARIDGQPSRDWMDDDAVDSIAAELNVSVKEVRSMESRMNSGDHSLSAPVRSDVDTATSWQDMMQDDGPTPEDVVIGMQDTTTLSHWLNEALNDLPAREQKIIRRRQLNEEVITLEELGKQLGISKERVRQLEQRAMGKIRNALTVKKQSAGLESDPLFV